MPSVLGKLGVTFLPPSKSYRPSPFKYNIPLPEQTKRQPSLYNTTQEEQPDFMSEYEKLVGGRPNRLAYQQAVEEGAPEIHRGKWAKLGALLAAGGAGLGGTPAAQAAKLGISAYQEPQMRSDEKYKQRIQGLGNLAQFEDSDIQEKSKALEFKYNDYYKRKQDQREDADLQIRKDKEGRDAGLDNEQLLDARQKREFAKWIEYQDSKDGNTYLRNRLSGERMLVGKTADTSSERLNEAREALRTKLWTELPFKMREEVQAQKDKMAQIEGTGANQLKVQQEKNQGIAARVATGLTKNIKPGDRYAQAKLELSAFMLNNPDIAAEDLLTIDEMGMPMVKPGNAVSDAIFSGRAEARDRLNTALGEIMDRAAKGGAAPSSNIPNAPAGNVGGNAPSPNSATAPPSNVDTGKTTTFVAPTGEELTISNDDPRYAVMIADPNLKVKGGVTPNAAVNAPAGNVNAPVIKPPEELTVDLNALQTNAPIARPRGFRDNTIKGQQLPPRADVNIANTMDNPFGNAPVNVANKTGLSPTLPPVVPPRPLAPPLPQPPNITPPPTIPNQANFNPNLQPLPVIMPPSGPDFNPPPRPNLDEGLPNFARNINPQSSNNFGLNINPSAPPPPPNVIPRTNAAMNVAGSMPQAVPTNPIDIGNQPLPFENMPNRLAASTSMDVNAQPSFIPTQPPVMNPALNTGNMIPPVMGNIPNVEMPPSLGNAPNPIQLAEPEPLSPEAAAMRLQPGGKSPFNMAPENPIKLGGPFKGKLPPPVEPSGEEEFNKRLSSIKEEVQKKLGVGLKIISNRRTAEQQAKLYASGRTTSGPWKTDADGTKVLSKHQTGEAADLQFVDKDGKRIGIDSKGRVTKEGQKLYDAFGKIAKDHGLVWGGDWDEKDYGHIQLGAVLQRNQ